MTRLHNKCQSPAGDSYNALGTVVTSSVTVMGVKEKSIDLYSSTFVHHFITQLSGQPKFL
jgi:hypothetical protein